MRRGSRVVRGITGGFALDLLATLLRLQERWSIAGDLLEVPSLGPLPATNVRRAKGWCLVCRHSGPSDRSFKITLPWLDLLDPPSLTRPARPR